MFWDMTVAKNEERVAVSTRLTLPKTYELSDSTHSGPATHSPMSPERAPSTREPLKKSGATRPLLRA